LFVRCHGGTWVGIELDGVGCLSLVDRFAFSFSFIKTAHVLADAATMNPSGIVPIDFGVFKMETDYLAASIKELEEVLEEAHEHAAQKDEADEYSGEWYEMIDLLTKIEGAIVSLKEATA
jgi:hypothetical protein